MKAVITVIGKDKKGIIAKVSGFLYENGINIEDISQTIMQDYFTMIMLVDTSDGSMDFDELIALCERKGEEIGVRIVCAHEEIFSAMHKV